VQKGEGVLEYLIQLRVCLERALSETTEILEDGMWEDR
jgi:hypothetical protein